VGRAVAILGELPEERAARVAAATPLGEGQLWLQCRSHREGTVGRLMERPPAVFRPRDSVGAVTEALRELTRRRMVVYVFVTESDGRLVGVVAFRELLLAGPDQSLGDVMLRDPFRLHAETPLLEAMRDVVTRHFPVYPVCDAEGRLLGIVRGQSLFEQQAFEISAQAGSMVGVEREERLATPWPRSFRSRHPWLQVNLLTALLAGAVVGAFQGTLDRIVLLAAFLPVLAGQSGNTGAQALAVTLRGVTLGELRAQRAGALVRKEGLLGLLNGILVGAVAGAAMFAVALLQRNEAALGLACVVLVAMVVSCVVSGVAGALTPLALRRFGADPATASAIVLSTATDVFSMGCLLALATLFVL
jgi:magnesium transporter